MKKISEVVLRGNQTNHLLEVPKNTEILSVRLDENDLPVVTCLYNTEFQSTIEKRQILIFKNDVVVDSIACKMTFVNTVVDEFGHVFHVFENILYQGE